MSRIVVVGGGLAGLTAAVRLADAGEQVTVLERLSAAGGRVRRIRGPADEDLDWGQHLMLGAYRSTRALARRLGTAEQLRFVERPTPLATESGGRHLYGVGGLPAPFHALPALFGLTHLGLFERLALGRPVLAAKLGVRLAPGRLDRGSALDWLRANGQSDGAIRGFWEPLVVATCNAAPAEASAALLATVIDQGFFAEREDALPLLPERTLHDALVGPALAAIAERRGEVRTGEGAVRLDGPPGGRITAVRTTKGNELPVDAVVLAVPSWDVAGLLPENSARDGIAEQAAWLGASPIVCVEVWFDRPWFEHPFAGLIGATVQWVFAHPPGRVPGAGQRLSLVVSRAGTWIERPNEELIAGALDELRRFFPNARAAREVATLVIRERRATFLGRPGQASRRPTTRTPVPNLVLAGDWTATGLPATIEGAVRSGEAAARALGARPAGEMP
jgi:squalene-associated FAD-dependent desaturase